MSGEYVTSESNLPEDPDDAEVRLQVSDKRTKEIFNTRARISRSPEDLNDPEPLTVVRGPHENIEEQWYIEVLETDAEGGIDASVLRSVMEDLDGDSNVINTRSEEVKVLLEYLTRTGKYGSVSEASRSIMLEYFSNTYPELVDEYVELKVKAERDGIRTELRDEE